VDYIDKPIRTQEVLARVNTHFALRRALAELEARNAELMSARDTLEERIRERSAELLLTNERLRQQIDERQRDQEKILHLASIVESSDDAIVGRALDGTVISWNRGAERIFGYSADEIVGRPVSILVPPELLQDYAVITEHIRRGEGMEHIETTRMRKDGKRIDVALTVSPLKDAQGRVVGASSIARDITDRRQSEPNARRGRSPRRPPPPRPISWPT
jgi:PAS domain S-box-containing protein